MQGKGITIITNFARAKAFSFYPSLQLEHNITINALNTCYAASFYLCPSLEIRPSENGI